MEPIAVILHLFLAFILITLILIQKGKGAGVGAAFGSGSSQTLFGSKGSLGFIVKLTIFIAALFFATSIAFNVYRFTSGSQGRTSKYGDGTGKNCRKN